MKYLLLIGLILNGFFVLAQNSYQYNINLNSIEDDSLFVEVIVPRIQSKNEIKFHFASIIPGVYSESNYGRLVGSFKPYDKKNNLLKFQKEGPNTWIIEEASKLVKITYRVSDTYDLSSSPQVFPPAGTNFEESNVILNAQGYVGFLEGYKNVSFNINITKPDHYYGITGLIDSNESKKIDTYSTSNYDLLVDSPIMYSEPDTSWVKVKNTDVLVGVYSPKGLISASDISTSIKALLEAQAMYLDGKLPVDKYAFIFYFSNEPTQIIGALEHSYSSIYFMQDNKIDPLESTINAMAAHEFFHILTPLNIHSEEIEDFDFVNPKMSKHLWLYESVTEYFAGHARLTGGLVTPDQYRRILNQKFTISDSWPEDLSLTYMSENMLNGQGQHFLNVYHHGAIVCLALDIKLRQLSQGKYGLRDLMNDLSKKYGKEKAFKDDELFNVIEELTYPEIRTFISRYIDGSEKLPISEILESIGLFYRDRFEQEAYSLGFMNIGLAEYKGKSLIQTNDEKFDEIGKDLGLQTRDIILEINDEPIPEELVAKRPFITAARDELSDRSTLKLKVARKKEGEYFELELEADVKKIPLTQKHYLQWIDDLDDDQKSLKASWMLEEI
ncbi:MAG: peptidase M61 [Fulvivirga sp.]|uniref:M61 family metallopeptidase n=1 Tax=Fulvivirga sp. TaxID=1931237 RepID=UPI0032EF384B